MPGTVNSPATATVEVEISSCSSRFWRRQRRKNPRIAKTTRARPPITPPIIELTRILFAVDVLIVAEAIFPVLVEVGREDKDIVVDDDDMDVVVNDDDIDVVVDDDMDIGVVDDDDVPFWIMR